MLHEHEPVDKTVTPMCRKILKAKLELLLFTINQVFPVDDIATIVPQAIYDVNYDIVDEKDLTADEAMHVLQTVEKHIATLSDLYAHYLANPVILAQTIPFIHQEIIMTNATNATTSASTESVEAITTVVQDNTAAETTNPVNQSTTTESATMNTNTSSSTSSTNEQAAADADLNATIAAAKSAARRRGFKTAGEVTSTVAIVGGAAYGLNYVRPMIIDKILSATGLGAATATVEVAAETVVVEVAAAEGTAAFLGGSVQVGSYAIPEVALAAAAVIAVAAVSYAGYKYYKGRQVKKAAAVGTEKPVTAAAAEEKIEAAVDAVEDGNLKSFLKGMLSGAKQATGSLKILAYINVAWILAAVAAGAGYPLIASLVYAAVGIYFAIVIAATVLVALSAGMAVIAIKGLFSAAATAPAAA